MNTFIVLVALVSAVVAVPPRRHVERYEEPRVLVKTYDEPKIIATPVISRSYDRSYDDSELSYERSYSGPVLRKSYAVPVVTKEYAAEPVYERTHNTGVSSQYHIREAPVKAYGSRQVIAERSYAVPVVTKTLVDQVLTKEYSVPVLRKQIVDDYRLDSDVRGYGKLY